MKVSLNIKLQPAADTFSAAVKSVLDHLGDKRPLWEIQGLSGYAFRILVHEDVCPSGTHHTNWKHIHVETFRRLGWEPRLFLHIDWDRRESFEAKRAELLDFVIATLKAGRPVILYDIYIPGWAIATGYNDDTRKLQVETFLNISHWRTVDFDKLGMFNLPILYALDPGTRLESHDHLRACREALKDAVLHYDLKEHSWRPKVRDGREAYNQWLKAVGNYPDAKCMPEGMADYSAKFTEWRKSAEKFCKEAAKLFPDNKTKLLATAKEFKEEGAALSKLGRLFPMPGGHGLDKGKIAQAKVLLQDAKTQYEAAIATMRVLKL